ncbi:L-rhamnose-binding lectin CSL2-like [Pundamilia nyererei]|uniref:L-rhamnose-binding lectin CSL2-like n=1 Tax=Pundamilia nyererei TaxID=303518 RepID=A0A3B4EQR3_9CICH|nr:PREDICTED: L-rhamnose-binding lectin CSL2-like [Pundamilia nyererei]
MLSSRLSSTLLLAATCVLMTSGFPRTGPLAHFPVSTERVITCDSLDSVQRLSCENGVIIVQSVLFGRTDAETCSEGRPAHQLKNTQCSQDGALKVVKSRCDGQKVCEINPVLFHTSSDPCYGIYKYVDTTYACFPAIHSVTCDDSLANLQCDEGQVLLIHRADYGRHDATTCSFNRPASQLQNVQCSKQINKVAESCNGKSSCTVKVSGSVFGEPCYGIYKYLEVAYSCHFADES